MKKFLLVVAVAVMSLVALPSLVMAAVDPPVDPAGAIKLDDTLASVQISAGTVTFLLATMIPILVGLLTKLDSKYKGLLMILLTAAEAAIVTAIIADGTAVFSQQTLDVFVKGLVGAYGSYYGLLKPRGITSSAIAIPATQPGQVVMVPGTLADKGIS